MALAALAFGAGAKVFAPARPLLRPEYWPGPLRALAETGCALRQDAAAQLLGWYHVAAPAIVQDIVARLDLSGVVRDVVEASDLPELVRLSTGSMATETVRDLRVRTMTADEAVSRWVGRILGRRSGTEPTAGPVAD
ncbi:hypothetical protein FG385_03285 [Amycolatopsis alkalitolerans]|uniref:Uncharacterized protein n=1 Tax=Amycolatopsis alkalitolerans TaxID=2547244 RepID=A0A5C4MCU2_9PSEU|nr:hypothetical protein FG385_03285 [Amycolatopsis alkalitolerans]